ncbi:hypothetical protein BC831DRAFT_465233 [Entophlyctis helioformis]|nr:hypothetical protein BC831DRAFT_465233 [Entophlyctis helioformis]
MYRPRLLLQTLRLPASLQQQTHCPALHAQALLRALQTATAACGSQPQRHDALEPASSSRSSRNSSSGKSSAKTSSDSSHTDNRQQPNPTDALDGLMTAAATDAHGSRRASKRHDPIPDHGSPASAAIRQLQHELHANMPELGSGGQARPQSSASAATRSRFKAIQAAFLSAATTAANTLTQRDRAYLADSALCRLVSLLQNDRSLPALERCTIALTTITAVTHGLARQRTVPDSSDQPVGSKLRRMLSKLIGTSTAGDPKAAVAVAQLAVAEHAALVDGECWADVAGQMLGKTLRSRQSYVDHTALDAALALCRMRGLSTSIAMLRVYPQLIKALASKGRLADAERLFAEGRRIHSNSISSSSATPQDSNHGEQTDWPGRVPRSDFVPLMFAVMIHARVAARQANEASMLYTELMREYGSNAFSLAVYSRLMNAIGQSGRTERMFSLFKHMQSFNIMPDRIVYSTLLTYFARGNHTDGMAAVLKDLETALEASPHEDGGQDSHFVIDTQFVNVVINAYAKLGMAGDAERWFQFAHSQSRGGNNDATHIAPDSVTYNAMIAAYTNAGMMGKAEELLQELMRMAFQQGSFAAPASSKRLPRFSDLDSDSAPEARPAHRHSSQNTPALRPDSATFGQLFAGYSRTRDYKSIRRLMGTMRSIGLTPRSADYYYLICAEGSADASRVAPILAELKAARVEQTEQVWEGVLRAYANAPNAQLDMVVGAYTALADAGSESVPRAVGILVAMRAVLNIATRESAAGPTGHGQGSDNSKATAFAHRLFADYSSCNRASSSISHIASSLFVSLGDAKGLEDLAAFMARCQFFGDSEYYNTVLKFHAAHMSPLPVVRRIRSEMDRRMVAHFDVDTLEALVGYFTNAAFATEGTDGQVDIAAIEEAQRLYHVIQATRLEPTTRTYELLIGAFSRAVQLCCAASESASASKDAATSIRDWLASVSRIYKHAGAYGVRLAPSAYHDIVSCFSAVASRAPSATATSLPTTADHPRPTEFIAQVFMDMQRDSIDIHRETSDLVLLAFAQGGDWDLTDITRRQLALTHADGGVSKDTAHRIAALAESAGEQRIASHFRKLC